MATLPVVNSPRQVTTVTATFSTAATGLSDVIDCGGLSLSGILMATAWTDATMTFLGSPVSSATLAEVYGSTGSAITFASTAGRLQTIDPFNFCGVRFIQLRSGTTGTPVAQAAARTCTLILTPYGPIK